MRVKHTKRNLFVIPLSLLLLILANSAQTVQAATHKIIEYQLPTPGVAPTTITSGPDGNLWFTELIGNQIGRITSAGIITEFPVPSSASHPFGITAGPDGKLWFTESTSNKIGKMTTNGTFIAA